MSIETKKSKKAPKAKKIIRLIGRGRDKPAKGKKAPRAVAKWEGFCLNVSEATFRAMEAYCKTHPIKLRDGRMKPLPRAQAWDRAGRELTNRAARDAKRPRGAAAKKPKATKAEVSSPSPVTSPSTE